MHAQSQVWDDNWEHRLASRIAAAGCGTMTEFLAKCPAEPYLAVADRLGVDLAAFQIEWMHFGEAKESHQLRTAAMDSLARDICSHLPDGWRHGAKGDFDTACARADWIVRLEQAESDLKRKAVAVWNALEESNPPVGWKPTGSDDPLIITAFGKGWLL